MKQIFNAITPFALFLISKVIAIRRPNVVVVPLVHPIASRNLASNRPCQDEITSLLLSTTTHSTKKSILHPILSKRNAIRKRSNPTRNNATRRTWSSSLPFSRTSRQATVIRHKNHYDRDFTQFYYQRPSVQLCSANAASRSIPVTLLRGAGLRIASDLLGGTPFECVKCQVTATGETAGQALQNILQRGGVRSLWTGSASRTMEGALVGAVFLMSSSITKNQLRTWGILSPTVTAMAAGVMGGLAQAAIMTPAGMIFTSLNVNRGKPGHENDGAIATVRRIVSQKGVFGLYYGYKPMALRQASNWASRSTFTEMARSVLGLQKYGILGEIGSGILGGLGSCWNTPIETIRVCTQRDLSMNIPVKDMNGYWTDIVHREGYPGLYRGVTPRALQAIWQTCFMVVVPTIMGI